MAAPLDLDAPETEQPERTSPGSLDELDAAQLKARLYPDDAPAGPADAPPVQPQLRDDPAYRIERAADQGEPEPDPHADQVVLFKISDRDYWVDADPDARILLRFMWTSRSGDELGALDGLLLSLLGEDQFEALMTGPKVLRKPQFQAIVGAAVQHLAGEDEAAPKGRTGRGRSGRGGRG